jgi:DNA-binding SARP family transcriptional activator
MRESPTPLRVHLFGHFSVERNGHIVTGLEPRRLQEAFSYLLLNRHRRCSRELLASLFWEESSTEQSKRNLRQVLWQLQTALQAEKAKDSECILCVTADWIQINQNAPLWLDVDFFERAWNETKHIPAKNLDSSQAQLLRDATGLHSDSLLLDNYEDWCLRERERLLLLCIAMLEKLMEHSELHHDYESALRFGSRILDYDPIHEKTQQQLMHLYYSLGKRIEALKQYRRYETALLEELGASPSKSIQALYQHIFLEQLGSESGTEALVGNLQGEASLLAHIMNDLQQVQNIQNHAQIQIDVCMQKIEQSLHTFIQAPEGNQQQPEPSEKRDVSPREQKVRKKMP